MNASKSKAEQGNPRTLTGRQEIVAAALAAGAPVLRVARQHKVHECTIWAWYKLPEFKRRVAELRQEMVDRAIGRLSDMMAGAAADTLKKLLNSKSEKVRLDSVKAVYELFVNVTNAAELKARIEQLEANMGGKK